MKKTQNNAIDVTKLLAALIMTIGSVVFLEFGVLKVNANAKPKVMPDGTLFDAEFYANSYPDLLAAFGHDETMLYIHYVNCGKNEGRVCVANQGQGMVTLNVPTKKKWEYTEKELIQMAINSSIKPGMNDFEKVKAVNKYLCDNIEYDYSYSRYSTFEALAYGSVVCQGYANAFCKIMNAVGVPTDYVSGIAVNSRGESGRHGWNRCLIDGRYYYVDVTWNDTGRRNNYLLVSDAEISRNHLAQRLNPHRID